MQLRFNFWEKSTSTSDTNMNVTKIYNDTLQSNLLIPHTNYTLSELNAEYALSKLGGIIFVGVLMILGVVGNAHVLYVYATKFKHSNHRFYIISLACLDLITCCIGMPFVIVDLRFPLLFTLVPVCKMLRFLNYFMCACSALILVVIAVDRYRKICKPFEPQMNRKTAKFACLIAVIISLSLSWPAPILYGHSTVDAETISEYFDMDINVTGVQCFTEDRFKQTKYQAFFNIILIFVILASTVILAVLYGLIGRKVFKQTKQFTRKIKVSPAGQGHSNSESIKTDSSGSAANSDIHLISNHLIIEPGMDTGKSKTTPKLHYSRSTNVCKAPAGASELRSIQKKKITFMLFVITLVFVLSFMPHLSLKTIAFLKKDFLPSLSFRNLVLYNTFVWSFFVNNAANPIIYGFCDERFRMEMKKLYCRRSGGFDL